MAFPWIFHANFEQGTNAEWDSETDGASPTQLDFPHYTELARFPGSTGVKSAFEFVWVLYNWITIIYPSYGRCLAFSIPMI